MTPTQLQKILGKEGESMATVFASVLTESTCALKHRWLVNMPDKRINIQKYLSQMEGYI